MSPSHLSAKEKYLAVAVMVAIVSIVIGYYLGMYIQQSRYADFMTGFKIIRENSDKFKYINPRLGGISPPATDVGIYTHIKSHIVSYLAEQKALGNLYDHSFYFRDINTGMWFGDNEAANFFPASLFKLPIAIAMYKAIEDDPSLLKRQVTYTQELAGYNSSVELNAVSSLEIGKSYTIEELVEKMLMLSDNGAKDLLLSVLDKHYINQLFSVVSLVDPVTTQVYEVSSRKYALFLTLLHNSTYLNEEHSELLLGMLTKATFTQGLVAGVPEFIPIAHKFGVYEVADKTKEHAVELHDCGIIYHPSNPYLLCIMTKGKDTQAVLNIIANLSKMVYEHQVDMQ